MLTTLTKEDYMKLPKERLAELLVEAMRQQMPVVHTPFSQVIPCYSPDGICDNPQRDCINCPKRGTNVGVITTTDTTGGTIKAKIGNPFDYIQRVNQD